MEEVLMIDAVRNTKQDEWPKNHGGEVHQTMIQDSH